jgi:hypothetical protein
MSSRQNLKVGVAGAHGSGSSRGLANRNALISQLVSILSLTGRKAGVVLSVVRSKSEKVKEALREVTSAGSILFFLTGPPILLCGSESWAILALAIPIVVIGVACGVIVFVLRSKRSHRFTSLALSNDSSR